MKKQSKSRAVAHLLDDPFLAQYSEALHGRARRASDLAYRLTRGEPLSDWANAHRYFGLHFEEGAPGGKSPARWVFREWAPNATSMWLVGDFSGWRTDMAFEASRLPGSDVWECVMPADAIHEGDKYHLEVRWDGGRGERIPAFARYVTQDTKTLLYSAQVYVSRYAWRNKKLSAKARKAATPPLIYEAHVGMGTEEEKVGSYAEFRDLVLPKIAAAGYNTVQLMAIMEHPYYASFGYHVSSFFAASSRFGTPDDLKSLVDAAHGLGLRVIMDIVHSHAVANERDGLSLFDGTEWQYFHSGEKGRHSAWGSRCFDYGKTQVLHFLLSNCKFWLEEYGFDGYRFDGVTSMLFWDHGLGRAFTDYSTYFDGSCDDDAWAYLNLANRVIHEFDPFAITIAEDVSGMPGVAAPVSDCGIGFDYRMAMGEPDFWFKLAGETRDEDWPMGGLFYCLTDKRAEEKVVSYVESHDQALVGGKTFFFTMADSDIYRGMGSGEHPLAIDRAVALHKMARLATLALSGGAYLNFMGNEFGHPEWIDFPREGNGWSYAHARRLWSLRDDPSLKFCRLALFDETMLKEVRRVLGGEAVQLRASDGDKVLAFIRGDLMFVFNFHPSESYTGYGVIVPPASEWRHLFDTDESRFGGQGRIKKGDSYSPVLVNDAERGELVQQIRLYLPARTAIVLRRKAGRRK